MARLRLTFAVALSMLCILACASSSPALGGPSGHAAQRRSVQRSTRARHAPPCAGSASFHARHGGSGHRRQRCQKRRQGRAHHPRARTPRRGKRVHTRRHSSHRIARHTLSGPRPGAASGRPDAANSSSCPDANLTPTPEDLERIRAATLCLVNRERQTNGERALQDNSDLDQSAQNHTESMAFGNYFEHDGPGGDTPTTRMRAAGYIYSSRLGYEVGENIGWGTLWLATPRAIVAAWMASSGHRANILDANFRDSGIGVSTHPPQSLAHGQSGGIYTQDFGVIITG